MGTGAGDRDGPRVRTIRQQRTEGDHPLDAKLSAEAEDLADELLPAHIWFRTLNEHDVPSGHVRDVDSGRWPGQPAVVAVRDCDEWSIYLVVVVILGVEFGDWSSLPDLGQMVDRRRCRLSRVVPSLEGGKHDGVDELGQILKLDHA